MFRGVPDSVERRIYEISFEYDEFPKIRRVFSDFSLSKSVRLRDNVRRAGYMVRAFFLGDIFFDVGRARLELIYRGEDKMLSFEQTGVEEFVFNMGSERSRFPQVDVFLRRLAYRSYHCGCGYASDSVSEMGPDYLLVSGRLERLPDAAEEFDARFEKLLMDRAVRARE